MTVPRTTVFLDHLCHRSAAAIWRDRRYKEGERPDIRGFYQHRSLFRTSVFIPYEISRRDNVDGVLQFTVRGCRSSGKGATLAAMRLAVMRQGQMRETLRADLKYIRHRGKHFSAQFTNQYQRFRVECDDRQILRFLLTKARASLELEKARAFDKRYGTDTQMWDYLGQFITVEKVLF